jgi:hypothetical protein
VEDAAASARAAVALLDAEGVLGVDDLAIVLADCDTRDACGDAEGARRALDRATKMVAAIEAGLRDDAARAAFRARVPEAARVSLAAPR